MWGSPARRSFLASRSFSGRGGVGESRPLKRVGGESCPELKKVHRGTIFIFEQGEESRF